MLNGVEETAIIITTNGVSPNLIYSYVCLVDRVTDRISFKGLFYDDKNGDTPTPWIYMFRNGKIPSIGMSHFPPKVQRRSRMGTIIERSGTVTLFSLDSPEWTGCRNTNTDRPAW